MWEICVLPYRETDAPPFLCFLKEMSFICNLAAGSVWAEGVLKSGHLSPDVEENTGSSRDPACSVGFRSESANTYYQKQKS